VSAEQRKLEREIENVMTFIREGDSSSHVREDLSRLEERLLGQLANQIWKP
jgi:hypothetical protein